MRRSTTSKTKNINGPCKNNGWDNVLCQQWGSARAIFFNTGHTTSTLDILTLVAVACPPSSAEGLECHGDVPATNGALVEPIGALEAKGVVPARNQRAVDLGVHAYLETNEHTLRARFIGFVCGFQHDVHHPQTRPK